MTKKIMKRSPRSLSALMVWPLSVFIFAGVVEAAQEFPFDPVVLSVEPSTRERVSVDVTGGAMVAGHFGGQMESCGVGTQAFVEKTGDWLRCQHSPLGGTCSDAGGEPLFAGFTCFDPNHIKASSVHGVFEEGNGDFLVTGEALIAWEDGQTADITTARSAFILRLDPDGVPLGSVCVGPEPEGPPADEDCCSSLCEIDVGGGGGGGGDVSSGGGSCGGRAVASIDGGRVVATGWCESTPDVLPVSKDYFVASFSHDLAVQEWVGKGDCRANQVGRAIAIKANGRSFFTGSSGGDIIVGKYLPDGTLKTFETGGGPMLDEGRSIRFDGQGKPVVGGIVNDAASFGGVDLGESGDGLQDFTATLNSGLQIVSYRLGMGQVITVPWGPLQPFADDQGRSTGEPLSLPWQRASMPNQLPSPPPEEPPPLQEENLVIDDFHVDIGTLKSGSLEGLIHSERGLVFTEGEDPAEPGALRIQFRLDMKPKCAPFKISSLGVKIDADSCYEATIELQGLLGPEFYLAGHREVVCPADSPLLVAEISPDFSELLGFSESRTPDCEKELVMRMTIDYHHTLACECPCPGECDCSECECVGSLEDGSADGVDIDY